MPVSDLIESAPQVAGGGVVVVTAFGVVALYRRLFQDGEAAWDRRLATLTKERKEDRSLWAADREQWAKDRAEWYVQGERMERRLRECQHNEARLNEEVGRLRGQLAGVQWELARMKRQYENGE